MMIEEDKKDMSFEDDFCRSLRQKLDGHRLPVEETDWKEMQALLKDSGAKGRKRSIGWIVGAAAAAVLLMICLIPFNQTEMEDILIEVTEFDSVTPEDILEEVTIKIPEEKSILKEEKSKEERRSSKAIQTEEDKIDYREDENSDLQDLQEKVIPEEKRKEQSKPSVQKDKKSSFYPEHYDIPLPGRKKNRWHLSAGVFTGGGIKNINGDSDYFYQDNKPPPDENGNGENPDVEAVLTKGHKEIQEMIDREEYENVSHSIPFSVGFTARKQVANQLAVETGLIYTYLSSEFAKSSGSKASYARTKQHYLGIPFNIVWDIVEENNWTLYLSAGGMLEKGIHLNLLKKGWSKEGYLQEKTSSGMSGVQVSLQFMPGLSYSLSKDWSLYVEPRLSYYFANGQPTSIRTEKSWVIGIGGGLRYSF